MTTVFPASPNFPFHTTAHKALRLWSKMKYKECTQNKTKTRQTWFRADRNLTPAPQLSCKLTVRCSCHLKCHVFMHALILNSHKKSHYTHILHVFIYKYLILHFLVCLLCPCMTMNIHSKSLKFISNDDKYYSTYDLLLWSTVVISLNSNESIFFNKSY